MYGKIFAQIYDGTLHQHWEALITFQQLIVLSDVEGVVEMTREALSARTGIPLEVIQKGVAVLEDVDPQSRTPDEDGRRIVRVSTSRDWGWQIVNHKKYRGLRDEDSRREYHRDYYQTKRKKSLNISTCLNTSQPVSTAIQDKQKQKQKQLTTTTTTSPADAVELPAAKPPPKSWVAEASDLWKAEIGMLSPGRIGKALKPAVDAFGWDDGTERGQCVKRWLLAYCHGQPYRRRDGSFDDRPGAPKNTTWCSPEDFVKTLAFWREQTQPMEAVR